MLAAGPSRQPPALAAEAAGWRGAQAPAEQPAEPPLEPTQPVLAARVARLVVGRLALPRQARAQQVARAPGRPLPVRAMPATRGQLPAAAQTALEPSPREAEQGAQATATRM
jgi:hypothetical protein